MKVLFVEDENVKQSNIVTYLKDELGVENISVVNSLMGGMLALRNGKFDIVLLDMSLPLYDINGEDEELNEFEAFGGIEILDEIESTSWIDEQKKTAQKKKLWTMKTKKVFLAK